MEHNYLKCKKCGTEFTSDNSKIVFDENGYGYSTKLKVCMQCGQIHIVKYYFDSWLNEINESR